MHTDEAAAYRGMIGMQHEAVKHSVGEWVSGMAHTNGLESFGNMFKRAYHGISTRSTRSIYSAMWISPLASITFAAWVHLSKCTT